METELITRKSSCMNSRGIPPTTQQVLAMLLCLPRGGGGGGGTPSSPGWGGGTPIQSWVGDPFPGLEGGVPSHPDMGPDLGRGLYPHPS